MHCSDFILSSVKISILWELKRVSTWLLFLVSVADFGPDSLCPVASERIRLHLFILTPVKWINLPIHFLKIDIERRWKCWPLNWANRTLKTYSNYTKGCYCNIYNCLKISGKKHLPEFVFKMSPYSVDFIARGKLMQFYNGKCKISIEILILCLFCRHFLSKVDLVYIGNNGR